MGLLTGWWKNKDLDTREKKSARIQELTDQLRQIPTGKMLMDFADHKQMFIRFSDRIDSLALYSSSRFVYISTKCPKRLQVMALAHELRHAWQDHHGLILKRVTNVRDGIVNGRFEEADAFAIEAQICWELSAHGVNREAWPAYKRENKAIAKAFEAEARRSKGAMNGKSLKAAFDAWFKTFHRASYDFDHIKDSERQLDNVARGKRAYVETDKRRTEEQPERMSRGYLREFGAVANGINYLENANTVSSHYTEIKGSALKRTERLESKHELATVRVK